MFTFSKETPTPKKQQAGARSSTTKRDHPYSERTTPRTRMKSLKGVLTKAKRKLYTTKQSLERKKKKIVNLVSVLAQLKEQHLLSNETEEELESFGELPEDLIKGWRSNVQMPASRRRYSDKMRKFATTLYYHSPKAYAYLSSTFPMPSKVTLRTWLKVVDGWPGFTQEALSHLKRTHEVSSEREKLCTIMLDGMKIRKKCDYDSKSGRLIGYVDLGNSQTPEDTDSASSATDSLVFMAVGVASPWKIPFGYFLNNGLTGELLKSLVTEAITLLTECKLEVVAVVCDALGSNVKMGKLLGCRIHESKSEDFVTSFPHPNLPAREVTLIFDAAHGLKLLRNLLGDKKFLQSTWYGVRARHSRYSVEIV